MEERYQISKDGVLLKFAYSDGIADTVNPDVEFVQFDTQRKTFSEIWDSLA